MAPSGSRSTLSETRIVVSGSEETIPHSSATRAAFERRLREGDAWDGEAGSAEALSTPLREKHQNDDILRLVPVGPAARMAFHELAQMKVQGEGLDAHHAQFIYVQGKAPLSAGEGYDSASSTSSPGGEDIQDDLIHKGYYRVHFTDCAPSVRGIKWALGKGVGKNARVPVQNVDILLAAPGSRRRRHLSAAHAFLRLHPLSGAWMLRAGSLCKNLKADPAGQSLVVDDPDGIENCNHEAVFLDGTPLAHSACRALTRPRTTLVLGGLHYSIEFCADGAAKEAAYLHQREVFFHSLDIPPLSPAVSGIPFESDILTPFAVFRRGLGRGSFGTVFGGFDPRTGDARAVKRLQVANSQQRTSVREEIEAGTCFSGHPGIVRCYGWCNASGEATLKGSTPFDVYLVQEKGISFHDYNWLDDASADWDLRGQLLKQLLLGLATIHAAGSMHRDITPMNILFFPDAPPHAALCDFGKFHAAPTGQDTALAAWRWLPPEILQGKRRVYNQKIDVWMLALALLHAWFPVSLPPRQLHRDDYQGLLAVLAVPGEHATSMENPKAAVAQILVQMMTWEPGERPGAREVLQTPFLSSIELAGLEQRSVHILERKRSRE